MRLSSSYLSGTGGVFEGGKFMIPPRADEFESPFEGVSRGSLMSGGNGLGYGLGQFEMFATATRLANTYDAMVARVKKLDPALQDVWQAKSDEESVGRRVAQFRIGEITPSRVDKVAQDINTLELLLKRLEAAETPDEIIKIKEVQLPGKVITKTQKVEVPVEVVKKVIPTPVIIGGVALAGVAGYFLYKHLSK